VLTVLSWLMYQSTHYQALSRIMRCKFVAILLQNLNRSTANP